MKKFEYWQLVTYSSNDGDHLMDEMNRLGKQGWELVNSIEVAPRKIRHLFKREVEQTETQPQNLYRVTAEIFNIGTNEYEDVECVVSEDAWKMITNGSMRYYRRES